MTEKIKYIGAVDQAQLEAWKKKHGDIFEIIIEGHIGYLKPVDRKVMIYALTKLDITFSEGKKMNLGQMVQSGEAILQNCWIGGSEEILKKDDLFISAAMEASYLVTFKNAELKKNC